VSGDIVERLRGQLVVSSQAMDPRSPLRSPETLALLAQAAALGGAGGFRVDGADVVSRLKAVSPLPVIGIVKDDRGGFDNYITTSARDVAELLDAGADVVAIQSTTGTRPGPDFAALAAAVHARGALVMADIATAVEARAAVKNGADLVATTMVGHTDETRDIARPPLALVGALRDLGVPVVVEGGIWTPEHVRESFQAGAHAVVCGSAITAPDIITRRLVAAIPRNEGDRPNGGWM
jgi:N-acylglucosamine-6-phosphate 2-epimerase